MKTRSLMLAVKAMLVHALEDYPFPLPERGTELCRQGR